MNADGGSEEGSMDEGTPSEGSEGDVGDTSGDNPEGNEGEENSTGEETDPNQEGASEPQEGSKEQDSNFDEFTNGEEVKQQVDKENLVLNDVAMKLGHKDIFDAYRNYGIRYIPMKALNFESFEDRDLNLQIMKKEYAKHHQRVKQFLKCISK